VPVKRRMAKGRRNHVVPDWATRLVAGESPAYGTEDCDEFAEWRFFQVDIPGLPPADSPDGERLLREAERCR
jgi:hypothetical protein